MASADITVVENPATIESDTTERVITKSDLLRHMSGLLVNASTVDTWCKVSINDTPASGVATTGAQAQLQFPLPAGASFAWLSHYKTIAHKTAASAAVLAWIPDKEYRR